MTNTLTIADLLGQTNPFQVAATAGIPLFIKNERDETPTSFALMGTAVLRKVCCRVTGGCSKMTREQKIGMLEFFDRAFGGYEGLVFSGATRDVANGELDPMVTDAAALIAARNNTKCIGTVPRTGRPVIVGDGRLQMGESGSFLNPRYAGIMVVQVNPEAPGKWDGDMETYLQLMDAWKTSAEFSAVGIVAWNGGGVTRKEIEASARKGWPTIVIKGSGRASDEFAAAFEADPAFGTSFHPEHKIRIVQSDNPESLRAALVEFGFLSI